MLKIPKLANCSGSHAWTTSMRKHRWLDWSLLTCAWPRALLWVQTLSPQKIPWKVVIIPPAKYANNWHANTLYKVIYHPIIGIICFISFRLIRIRRRFEVCFWPIAVACEPMPSSYFCTWPGCSARVCSRLSVRLPSLSELPTDAVWNHDFAIFCWLKYKTS